MGRRLALLIATYHYQDSGLRRLVAPAQDAESFAGVLKDPGIAGFEVTTLINEPHHVVGGAIGDFYRDRRRDDLTLLYFTGHGLKDDGGRLYLAMSNTRRDSLLFTALSAEQIDQAMESCASRQKVLILDCCYSGAFPAGRLAKGDTQVHALERFQGRGRTVLTASDATQYSFEGNRPQGEASQSVFTRYLVAGLQDGSADLDGDGDITLDELYSYVHDRVVEEMPQQRPKKQDNVEGRTIIARNINWSMPAYLSNAISSPIATDRLGAVDALAHLHRIGNDTVRASALAEIRRLADDDSRSVSAAAEARLRSIEPASGQPAEAVVPPPPEPVAEPVAPAGPVSRATGPSALERPRSGWRAWRLPHVDLLPLAAGIMAIIAAGLIVAGILLPGLGYGSVEAADSALVHPRYAIGVAAVAALAGLAILLPRVPSQVGPGIALGVAAASTWGLVFYVGMATRDVLYVRPWTEIGGHVALLAAGVLAGLLVRRDRVARIDLRPPRDLLTRVAFVAGGVAAVAGTLALGNVVHQIARFSATTPQPEFTNHARAYVVAMVVTITVPLWAAIVVPRRLGLSILAGWIGGGWAIMLTTRGWVPHRFGLPDREPDTAPAIAFAGALLLLMTALAVASRRPAEAIDVPVAVDRRRRLVLVAGLATVSLVTAASGVAVAQVAEPLAPAQVSTHDVVMSPDGSRAYVLTRLRPWDNDGPVRGQVVVVDTASGALAGRPIPVGDYPADIAVSSGGDYLYVANAGSDTVTVISTRENTTVGEPIPVGSGPERVFVGSDGDRVYVVNAGSGTVSMVDTTSNRVVGAPIPLGDGAGVTTVSPDGGRIYATNGRAESGPYHVRVLDTGTGEAIGDAIPLDHQPAEVVVSPDGGRVYIGTGRDIEDPEDPERVWVLDTETNRIAGTPIQVDAGGLRAMAISPDGGRLYVSGYFGGVSVIDTRTGAIVGDSVYALVAGMAVSPDGRRLYAATSRSFLYVFETADPSSVTTIDVENH